MKYKLQVDSFPKKISFKKESAYLKFFTASKDISRAVKLFEAEFGVKLNSLQRKNFLDKKTNEIRFFASQGSPGLFILRKAVPDEKFDGDFFRNYLSGILPDIGKEKIKDFYIDIPGYAIYKKYFDREEYYYQTFLEGVYLGNYTFDKYKSDAEKSAVLNINFLSLNKSKFSVVTKLTKSLMSSVFFARDLVCEPAIVMTPKELALRIRSEMSKNHVTVKEFNKAELKRRKMNAILAVGNASTNPPELIILHYKGSSKPKRKIALVGKGVTYDTGGLSLKPTSNMLEMKADMAGAAAVAGIILAAAKSKLNVELIGVIPAVENSVSGNSYKPGDIIRAYSGKTIEVKDTDAEGRIILADALHYASEQKPDEILDFATLTGAICVALGLFSAGLFTKNDILAEKLIRASDKTHERIWRMPFDDDYNELIKSEIADVANLGSRWGGAITAGKFLEHFVDKKIPYAHLDIAGPALKHKYKNYTEKYETGFGVRLIFDYLNNL